MASWIEMPSTASNEDWNISKDKDPTASLGSLLLGLITVMVNHFYPTSGQNLPCCNVCLSASHPCTGHLGNLIHILQIGNSNINTFSPEQSLLSQFFILCHVFQFRAYPLKNSLHVLIFLLLGISNEACYFRCSLKTVQIEKNYFLGLTG